MSFGDFRIHLRMPSHNMGNVVYLTFRQINRIRCELENICARSTYDVKDSIKAVQLFC